MKMNSDYFVALAQTFEQRYGVEFDGIRDGAVTDPRERLIQFKTNIDVVMSVLERDGLGDWLADRLVEIGDSVTDDLKLRIDVAARSIPGRAAPGRESARGAADPHGDELDLGRGEAGQDRAVPQGRRGRRAPAGASRRSSSG